MGRPHRWLGRRAALLLGDGTDRRPPRPHARPAVRAVSRSRRTPRSSTNACCAAATAPASRPATIAARPTVATPHPAVMLAGDGIRIDLPVALMERAATTGWSAANGLLAHYGLAGHRAAHRPGRRPVCCAAAARAAGTAVGRDERARRLKAKWVEVVAVHGASARAVGEPAAHVHGRRARDHRRGVARVRSARPSGNWYAFAASDSIRKSPFGTSVGGVEIVAWRDVDGTLHVGPATLPAPGRRPVDGHRGLRCADLPVARAAARRAAASSAGSRIRPTTTGCWPGSGSTASAARSRPKRRWCLRGRTGATMHAVTRLVGTCEPSDIIANRLDPWHGCLVSPVLVRPSRRAVRTARRCRTTRGAGPLPRPGDVPRRPVRSARSSPSSSHPGRAPS